MKGERSGEIPATKDAQGWPCRGFRPLHMGLPTTQRDALKFLNFKHGKLKIKLPVLKILYSLLYIYIYLEKFWQIHSWIFLGGIADSVTIVDYGQVVTQKFKVVYHPQGRILCKDVIMHHVQSLVDRLHLKTSGLGMELWGIPR